MISFGKARRSLRRADRALGFASAAQRGKLPQWGANRIIGKAIGKATRRAWRR